MSYIPRLKSEYKDRITTRLTEEFGYSNIMQVPELEKIVLSRGVGAVSYTHLTLPTICSV